MTASFTSALGPGVRVIRTFVQAMFRTGHRRSTLFVGDLLWLRDHLVTAGRLVLLQVLIQALGAVSGFIFVRTMVKHEYAWFTIATAFATTLAVLADLGTGAGVQALAAPIWKNGSDLSTLVMAAQQVRRRLAVGVSLVVGPVFLYLLTKNGASIWYGLVLTIVAFATVWFTTATVAWSIVCRTLSRYEAVQAADARGAASKLAIATVGLASPLNALAAVTAGLTAAVVQYLSTKRVAAALVTPIVGDSDLGHYRKQLVRCLRPLLVPTLFFVFQGQLGVGVLGLFGGPQRVADLGALGRLGAVFAVLATVAVQVSGASFARCDSKASLLRQARRIIGGTFLAFAGPAAIVLIAPGLVLRLLGPAYSHLAFELRLQVGVSLFGTLSALLWALDTSRGWMRNAWMVVPTTLVAQMLCVYLISPSTVAGVLCLASVHQVSASVVYLALAVIEIRRWREHLA